MNFAQNQKIQKLLKPCIEPMNYLLNYFRALWPTSMRNSKKNWKKSDFTKNRVEIEPSMLPPTQQNQSGLTTIG